MSLDFTKDLPDADLNSGSSSMPPSIETDASNNKVTIHLSPHERAIIAHGVLVSVGFLVLLPLGSLVARWGRTVTPSWFKAHRIFNFYIALPVILVGWLLGPIAVFDAEAEHFLDAHQVLSLSLIMEWLGSSLRPSDLWLRDAISLPGPSLFGTVHTRTAWFTQEVPASAIEYIACRLRDTSHRTGFFPGGLCPFPVNSIESDTSMCRFGVACPNGRTHSDDLL